MAARDDDTILDVDGVAEYLQLSRSKIYNMLTAGELPGHRLGKQWRFRRSAVDAWLNAQPKRVAGLTARGVDLTGRAPGLTARSLNEPVFPHAARTARLTTEQLALLRGLWIDRPEQFLAIAAKPDGRASLARLLSIEPESVDAIAHLLESAPHAWAPDQTSGR
jgi:excisionase family DNA binding protein